MIAGRLRLSLGAGIGLTGTLGVLHGTIHCTSAASRPGQLSPAVRCLPRLATTFEHPRRAGEQPGAALCRPRAASSDALLLARHSTDPMRDRLGSVGSRAGGLGRGSVRGVDS